MKQFRLYENNDYDNENNNYENKNNNYRYVYNGHFFNQL